MAEKRGVRSGRGASRAGKKRRGPRVGARRPAGGSGSIGARPLLARERCGVAYGLFCKHRRLCFFRVCYAAAGRGQVGGSAADGAVPVADVSTSTSVLWALSSPSRESHWVLRNSDVRAMDAGDASSWGDGAGEGTSSAQSRVWCLPGPSRSVVRSDPNPAPRHNCAPGETPK